MNPYGIERPQLDLVEIARWNHANQRARAAYRFRLARLAGLCTQEDCDRRAGVANLCWKCQQVARSDKRRAS